MSLKSILVKQVRISEMSSSLRKISIYALYLWCFQEICYRSYTISARGVHMNYEAGCRDAGVCSPQMFQGDVCRLANSVHTCHTCRETETAPCSNVTGKTLL